MKSETKPVLNR